MSAYSIPQIESPIPAVPGEVLLIANGDLRQSANQVCWPAQSEAERAVIAASVFHRYSGDEDFPQHMALQGLLDKDDEKRALRLGLAWRFAFSLSASAVGELSHYKLRLSPAKIILEVPTRREAIAGDPVQKRLGALAEAFDRRGEILVG